ncbi:hypothetical protein Goklo_001703 [Gossypium klotzschianum]|uniref:RNase H type-1 domain-containing protein n=1 Tax=Gossypium klotzschianum TaxID=34286 RepID=A0A7J8W1B3_9ROSI|nr:hypothetical protein [Gossypium klotzschianum]
MFAVLGVIKMRRIVIMYPVDALQRQKSASGLVVRNVGGKILASKSVIHSNIATPFAAKAHAGLQAVKLEISMGFNVLQIIGDSRTIKNTFAHFVTVEALKKGEDHYLVGDIPSSACCAVERKRPRHPD